MTRYDSLLRVTLSGIVALSALSVASADQGAGAMEQCAGIVKAGKNDCATPTNDCHGHVTQDGNSNAWIYVPKGTCERIVGGHVVHVTEPKKTS